MIDKFSHETQAEINKVMKKIRRFENFFEFQTEYYFNGWAISLREQNLYPRYIIIFKSYDTGLYSIKSFEVHLKNYQEEEFREIYSNDHLEDANAMLEELKDVIYGKDLIEEASKIYKDVFID
jgi:hypothetical protein